MLFFGQNEDSNRVFLQFQGKPSIESDFFGGSAGNHSEIAQNTVKKAQLPYGKNGQEKTACIRALIIDIGFGKWAETNLITFWQILQTSGSSPRNAVCLSLQS